MHVLITGAGSQLTAPLSALLESRGHSVQALSHAELDIRDLDAATAAAAGADAVVNLAAANSVDVCEADPILAYEGNTLGPLHLARAAKTNGAAFVHFSSDFVHGGLEDPPDEFTESTPVAPVNVYGHSKYLGEEAVAGVGGGVGDEGDTRWYVLRTSWVIGERFCDFVRSSIDKGELRIPPVGHACPAVAHDLVAVATLLLEGDAPSGVWNVVNPPATDRPALLRTLVEVLGGDPDIVVLGEDTRPARRPRHSALGVGKLTSIGVTMPHWTDSVRGFVAGEPSALL
jgi:dTDP-4-dehydrorhamnose reductase